MRISCERDQRDRHQSYEEEEEGEEEEEDLSYFRPTFKLQSERSAVASSPSLRRQSLVNTTVLRHTKEVRSYNTSISTPTTV